MARQFDIGEDLLAVACGQVVSGTIENTLRCVAMGVEVKESRENANKYFGCSFFHSCDLWQAERWQSA